MADFVAGACAAVLVSFAVVLAAAWAYWHGYDSGFEAGEMVGKGIGGSGKGRN